VDARLPVLAAVRRLPELVGRRRVGAEELESSLVTGSWRRLVFANPELSAGVADHRAFVFCVLEQLHRGLRRREIYAIGADRWGDPRARLLDGVAWQDARPRVLKALDPPTDPEVQLRALSITLDGAYRQVAGELTANGAAVIDKGRLRLQRLGPAPEPPEREIVRGEIAPMMPRVDFPEVLLEIFAMTGVVDGLTRISGAQTGMGELEISLRAVLLAEACNLGLRPVVNPAVRALTRGRLRQRRRRVSPPGEDQRRQRPFHRGPEQDPGRAPLGRRDGRLRGWAAVRGSGQIACGRRRTRATSAIAAALPG
jgi:Tn3 transposase DDE domain